LRFSGCAGAQYRHDDAKRVEKHEDRHRDENSGCWSAQARDRCSLTSKVTGADDMLAMTGAAGRRTVGRVVRRQLLLGSKVRIWIGAEGPSLAKRRFAAFGIVRKSRHFIESPHPRAAELIAGL
jgi:hypothetical protein